MKSKWIFRFECKAFRVESIQRFGGYIDREAVVSSGMTPVNPDFTLTIEPDEDTTHSEHGQFGKLGIILSGDKEETEEIAYWIADHISEYISAFNGQLRISYGFVAGELLPETMEEQERLGENRYFATVRLIKEASPRPLNPEAMQSFTLDSSLSPMLKQFNVALSANSPIDQFLGLFKILEDCYTNSTDRNRIAIRLKRSNELAKIARRYLKKKQPNVSKALSHNDYFRLIDELVSIRHQCAHLISKRGFGIPHGDPMVRKKVLPLIVPLRRLALEAIRIRLGRA